MRENINEFPKDQEPSAEGQDESIYLQEHKGENERIKKLDDAILEIRKRQAAEPDPQRKKELEGEIYTLREERIKSRAASIQALNAYRDKKDPPAVH